MIFLSYNKLGWNLRNFPLHFIAQPASNMNFKVRREKVKFIGLKPISLIPKKDGEENSAEQT